MSALPEFIPGSAGYGRIKAVPGDDGRIARLDWLQNGGTYPAPRVSP